MKLNTLSNDQFKSIGNYKFYENCRFCNIGIIIPVIDLGIVPLAGGFIEKKFININTEYFYPLRLGVCKKCIMLQTIEVVDANTMFGKYYYSTSKILTLKKHLLTLAEEISKDIKKDNKFVVEIGSNDGVLVKALHKKKINVIGVDPAKNIVLPQIRRGVPLVCAYFNMKTAHKLLKKHGKADVITSSNAMAHIEEIKSVYSGIKMLLKNDGYGIIEVHYLKKLMEEFQYDMIYHEHLYYYSVHSMIRILKLFGLELYDAIEIPIHAGSIRFYIQHLNGPKGKNANLKALLEKERKLKLDKLETYTSFNNKMKKQKESLVTLITRLKNESKSIAGYGASGRGTTIMNYSSINSDQLDYVMDDSILKQGRFTPGNHLKIINSKVLNSNKRPDYTLLFAWSFYDEILSKNTLYLKNGGKFILPLPTVKIVP